MEYKMIENSLNENKTRVSLINLNGEQSHGVDYIVHRVFKNEFGEKELFTGWLVYEEDEGEGSQRYIYRKKTPFEVQKQLQTELFKIWKETDELEVISKHLKEHLNAIKHLSVINQ